jgi:hypothetical protein
MGRPHNFLRRIRAMQRDDELAVLKAQHEILERGPPAGSGITPENWYRCHEYEYFVCPRSRHTCDDPDCGLGASCKGMRAYGLTGDGRELPRKLRPACAARNRRGEPCSVKVVPGKRRCRFHGGVSTGPKTAAGRERIAAAQRRRWARWRGHEPGAQESGVVAPVKASPDIICGQVAGEPEVRAAATCRDLVAARLAAQARIGIPEADRAPLYSGEVEAVLIPIMFRMRSGDERAVVVELRKDLTELYGEFSETVLRFMLKTYRHGGTEALQRAARATAT